MIWYFLAGMIAGAVGIVWLLDWYSRKMVHDECENKRAGCDSGNMDGSV